MTKIACTINNFITAVMMPVLSSNDYIQPNRLYRLGIDYPFQLKIPEFAENSPQCHIYTFSKDYSLLESYEDIDYSREGRFTIPLDVEARNLYMLLNNDPFVLFGVDVTENNIANAIQISSVESEPELFMSGIKRITSINPASEFEEFPVVYGLSRIDLNPGNDERLSVDGMEISGCPDRSYVFGKDDGAIPITSSPVIYKKKFSPSIKKENFLKDVFHVYESGIKPVEVTVHYTYDGIQSKTVIPIKNLKRNHIYTIELSNVNCDIIWELHIKKWMDGEMKN